MSSGRALVLSGLAVVAFYGLWFVAVFFVAGPFPPITGQIPSNLVLAYRSAFYGGVLLWPTVYLALRFLRLPR
jgi:hypothetical protein